MDEPDGPIAVTGAGHVQGLGDVAGVASADGGVIVGTVGEARRLEALSITLSDDSGCYVAYRSHLQGTGWEAFRDSLVYGTTGQSRRLEAMRLTLANQPEAGGIEYAVHVQGTGWQDPVSDGAIAGTTGQSRRVEAVRMSLTSEMATGYSVWYRVHSQTFGWLGWAHDGEDAGTVGLAKRAEAVDVQVLPAGQMPGDYGPGADACVISL